MPIGTPNPNTGLIYYAEWMQLTHSSVYSRSAELKKIDEALLQAEKNSPKVDELLKWFADLSSTRRSESARVALVLDQKLRDLAIIRVRDTFNNFAKSKGTSDWRRSNRNGSGALTAMHAQLAFMTPRLPPVEAASLMYIETERNKSIPALFVDCKVVGYSDRLTTLQDRKIATSQALGLRTVYTNANDAGMGAPTTSDVENLLREIGSRVNTWVHEAFGGHGGSGGGGIIEEIGIKTILDEAIREIKFELAAIVPIAGLASASATFVFHTVNLVMQSMVADSLVDLDVRLETGDSRTAISRLKDWQLAEIAKTTSNVVRSGVNVGAHAAAIASCGLGVAAQLAISVANAVLALAAVIGDLGIQYKRKKALEKYLAAPSLGREIFAQSPLAAAYYMLNTPDSHVALQLVRIGAPGWQADVERIKKDGELTAVTALAAKVIDKSKYRIRKSDMAKLRETVGVSTLSQILDKARGPATITA
jgi:hypothetical protein